MIKTLLYIVFSFIVAIGLYGTVYAKDGNIIYLFDAIFSALIIYFIYKYNKIN
jgi:hypothetical protein